MDFYYGGGGNSGNGTKVKIFMNGDLTQSAEVFVKKNSTPKQIQHQFVDSLGLKGIKRLRIFNKEGVELMPEDFEYIDDDDVFYLSRGEDFDPSSGLSEYEILDKIGEGGFGEVVVAKHKITGEKYAIKFMKASVLGNAQDIDMVFGEASTLKNLDHAGIVKMVDCFTLKKMQVAFVMEYLGGGELKDYILERGHLSESESKEIFSQIAQAMYYCHRNNIIHRDLKLENVLLKDDSSNVVKIIDFGISGIQSNLGIDSEAGSLDYMTPEVLTGRFKNVHPGLDVWALGCMLFGMVAGALPFYENGNAKKMVDRIVTGQYSYPPQIEKQLSKEIKDLIANMMAVDYEQRYNMIEVVNHPWMTGEKLPDDKFDDNKKVSFQESKAAQNKTQTTTTTNTASKPTIPLNKASSPGVKKSTTSGSTGLAKQRSGGGTTPSAKSTVKKTTSGSSALKKK